MKGIKWSKRPLCSHVKKHFSQFEMFSHNVFVRMRPTVGLRHRVLGSKSDTHYPNHSYVFNAHLLLFYFNSYFFINLCSVSADCLSASITLCTSLRFVTSGSMYRNRPFWTLKGTQTLTFERVRDQLSIRKFQD